MPKCAILQARHQCFPLWTYGYFQSKERYKSQDEMVGVVKKYRELSVPLDGIIQDWQYWGNNYLWNAMEFLNDEFPKPKKMVDDVHNYECTHDNFNLEFFWPENKTIQRIGKNRCTYEF